MTGQVTERDYIAGALLDRQKARLSIGLGLLVAFAAGIILLVAATHKWGLILMFAAAGGAIGDLVYTRFVLQNKLRRLYAQMKGRVDVSYTWDDDNLFLSSERGSAARPWSDIIKAKENDDVVLLYVNDALFTIIAKRWFGDAADLESFRSHLKFVR